MARKSASNAFTASSEDGNSAADADAVMSDWLTTQASLFTTCLAQFTNGQMAMLTSWLELQNELSRQWQVQAADLMRLAVDASGDDTDGRAVAWAATPAALYQPPRRMLNDWWSQWSNLWQRGGEQLA
jgi:hypothetical protein